MKEACGVVGIVAPNRPVAHWCFDALFALQHRGQESAGMATFDGESITVMKDNGLVFSVFDERTLMSLRGSFAIGHTRYSTSGSANWTAAQPVYRSAGHYGFAISHNGNLTNTEELAREAGILPGVMLSDSDLVAELLAMRVDAGASLEEALGEVLPTLEGAYSLAVLEGDAIYGIRDPFGFRPLCLGRLGTEDAPEGWVVASESPALDIMGAAYVREIRPGEMVKLTTDGVVARQIMEPASPSEKLCIFEFVYFARPDSYLMGHQVHTARKRMGELLAGQSRVDADLVVGVPDSGVPAAEGYAAASGITFGYGMVKNRYIGRTFIAPDQNARATAVRRKLNPLRENIAGQRLIVVDDSIVRGTTTKALVAMLRDAGAAEVHLRISSPPFMWPCYYGIDTPRRDDLLAATHSVEEMRVAIDCDSLEFITLENLRAAIQITDECCDACLTGTYPTSVPVGIGRRGENS
ncbi:MAG: amidophosphoribosyltransferase [Actinomycetota bacterium]|jgi:amidophosphoribosyltransferase